MWISSTRNRVPWDVKEFRFVFAAEVAKQILPDDGDVTRCNASGPRI